MSRKNVKEIKRRFATRYYNDVHANGDAYSSQGAASTTQGAMRATVVRIFMREHAKAVIYDRVLDTELVTVRIGPHGLQANYADGEQQMTKLRRVK